MRENVLEKIFESIPKVRLLRLFIQNPEEIFSLEEIVKKTRIRNQSARNEIKKMLKIGLLKEKTEYVKTASVNQKSKNNKTKQKKVHVFYTNPLFPLFPELKALIVKSTYASREKMLSHIQGIGKIKLAILSGIFVDRENSRTDMLIVCDNINRKRLENLLAFAESELGRSLRYTVMNTTEFKYRINMYDRFLRDILEFPHEKLIDKFGL